MEEDEMEEDGMEDDESEEDESEEDESEEDESEEDESKEGENLEKESINFTSDKYSEKSIESNGGSITSDINNTNQEYIDSSSLVGKKGLSRIMNFTDTLTPLEKGSFSYKNENKYGRIFSPSEIGKYSSKIKNICDIILESEGIILIYSQYLDAGLIPMALALEEIGFSRNNNNNLFKERPNVPLLDSLTMKPKDKLNTDESFSPAKYSMITGDTRLTPNSKSEIQALTNINNKNGKYVKVVLISKAGSEGVDFKFIRQVHIMEPWYTMKRAEQVEGRAIRSFSHKDLPFENRNVEIYMHGTLLNNNIEEAADLYVYRVAMHKAIQIGKMTRILKETAVDCILNNDQVNYTQKNMNISVKQILSNKNKVIDEFPVGDIPYTSSCDYMDNCEFKCIPFKNITEKDINNDTFNETFIVMNSDKILQKIRQLMKEKFFYKKDELISRINNPKEYPYVQIYSALTQLIEDSSEIIMDKYKRPGYLINIGDYYLFQPRELTGSNLSIYDRSVPIDYKRNMIEFKVKTPNGDNKNLSSITSSAINSKSYKKNNEIEEDVVKKNSDISSIISNYVEQYELALSFINKGKVPRGDNNWYKHCGFVMGKMNTDDNIPLKQLKMCLIHHMLDISSYNDLVLLLNYTTTNHIIPDIKIEDNDIDFSLVIKEYFDRQILKTNEITGIILYQGLIRHVLILNESTNTWDYAQSEDKIDLEKVIKNKYQIDADKFNDFIGFMEYDTSSKIIAFKVKNRTELRTSGARCDQAGKSKNLILLNKIVDSEKYTKDNIKPLIDIGVCCLEELLLRYYNMINRNNNIWFLDPSDAREYDI